MIGIAFKAAGRLNYSLCSLLLSFERDSQRGNEKYYEEASEEAPEEDT